jgi:hypothetical protein
VTERLLAQALLRFQDVTVCGPPVRRSTGDLAGPEVAGRRPAVLCRELELGRRFVVELRLGAQPFEPLAQFQTFTSR